MRECIQMKERGLQIIRFFFFWVMISLLDEKPCSCKKSPKLTNGISFFLVDLCQLEKYTHELRDYFELEGLFKKNL